MVKLYGYSNSDNRLTVKELEVELVGGRYIFSKSSQWTGGLESMDEKEVNTRVWGKCAILDSPNDDLARRLLSEGISNELFRVKRQFDFLLEELSALSTQDFKRL